MQRPGYLFGEYHPTLGITKAEKRRARTEAAWVRKDQQRNLKRTRYLAKMQKNKASEERIANVQAKWRRKDEKIEIKREKMRAAWNKIIGIRQTIQAAKSRGLPVPPQARAQVAAVRQEVQIMSQGSRQPGPKMAALLQALSKLEQEVL